MASLRARLLAGVLALTAVGMLLAGRHHLRRAAPLPLRAHRRAGAPGAVPRRPGSSGTATGDGDRPPPRDGGPLGPARRHVRRAAATASGTSSVPYARRLRPGHHGEARPARQAAGRDRHRRRHRRQRATACSRSPTASRGGITVAAVPLTEADAHLERLLVVRGARDRRRAARARSWPAGRSCASGCSRSTAWATPPGAIAGGDLSHRVEATDRAHRGRPARDRAQRHARPARGGVRPPQGERGPAAHVHRRRLARAAHAAGLDPRLRRAVPHGRRARARGHREGDAPHRGRGRAHGRAGRGPAHARAARRDRRRAARRGRPRRGWPATRSTTRAPPPPTARSRSTASAAPVLGDAHQLRQVLANLLRNALVHTPAGTPIECRVARENGSVRLEVRDHGPGPADRRRRRDLRALLARRGRPQAGAARGAGLGLAIVAGIVDAHGGPVGASQRGRRRRLVRGAARRSQASSQGAPGLLPRGGPTLGA